MSLAPNTLPPTEVAESQVLEDYREPFQTAVDLYDSSPGFREITRGLVEAASVRIDKKPVLADRLIADELLRITYGYQLTKHFFGKDPEVQKIGMSVVRGEPLSEVLEWIKAQDIDDLEIEEASDELGFGQQLRHKLQSAPSLARVSLEDELAPRVDGVCAVPLDATLEKKGRHGKKHLKLFYPDGEATPEERVARAMCAGCPAVAACLEESLSQREEGIWAGTDLAERNELLKERVRTAFWDHIADQRLIKTVVSLSEKARHCIHLYQQGYSEEEIKNMVGYQKIANVSSTLVNMGRTITKIQNNPDGGDT